MAPGFCSNEFLIVFCQLELYCLLFFLETCKTLCFLASFLIFISRNAEVKLQGGSHCNYLQFGVDPINVRFLLIDCSLAKLVKSGPLFSSSPWGYDAQRSASPIRQPFQMTEA
jgi:hypothetical protein